MLQLFEKIKAYVVKAVNYLVGRLTELSTLKGLILVIGGGGWHELDSASRGEVIMQVALIVLGLLQIFLPQQTQYGAPPKD